MALVVRDVKPGRKKSELTRRKILRAAHHEFLASGYAGATVAAIAKRAGVAVQTVYFVFHTKADLISGVIDLAVMGEDEPIVPQEAGWWAEMTAKPDAAETLRIFVRGAAPLFERAAAISEVLRTAALTDPELRRTHERHEALRRAGFAEVIGLLISKRGLREGLEPEQAIDVFLTVCGDAVWHQLRGERGWSAEQVADWMCSALPALLLEPDGEPQPPATSRAAERV